MLSGAEKYCMMKRLISLALLFVALQGCFRGSDQSGSVSSFSETESDTTLGSLAEARGIRLGTFFFDPDGQLRQIPAVREFNLYTLPVFFTQIWPERNAAPDDVRDFHFATDVGDFAPPGTVFKIPGLIWCGPVSFKENAHQQFWLNDQNLSGQDMRRIMDSYLERTITFFQNRYPDRIIAFDIVNEPISYNRDSRRCPWHRIGLDDGDPSTDGYKYIELALKKARELAPNAKLYVNNFLAEAEDDSAWSSRMNELIDDLKARDVPLDGVGLQSHFMIQSGDLLPAKPECAVYPLPSDVEDQGICSQLPPMPAFDLITKNLNRLAALGLETMITEADLSIRDEDVSPLTLAQQANDYRLLLRACLISNNCKAFTTWGVGDADSWIPDDANFEGWGHPLLFDSDYKPKMACDAIRAELGGTGPC